MKGIWKSWNGNISHDYQEIFYPKSEKELCQIIQKARSVRMIGTGKSSADIVAGTSTLISYENLNQIIAIDKVNHRVTVQTGVKLKRLLQTLEKENISFGALPDIDDITVGGAISTGTHGTGREAQSLSEYVIQMKLVTAEGELLTLTEKDESFFAARVSLGLLGVVTEVTFQCETLRKMHITERPMKDSQWLKTYREMLKKYNFLRILWLPHTGYGYVITGNYAEDDSAFHRRPAPKFNQYRRSVSKILYGFTVKHPAFTALANRIIYYLFFRKKQQKIGSLYQATVTKSRGSTLELAEWTVDIEKFDALFIELKEALNDKSNSAYAHIPMDIRFVRQEKAWLSNAQGRDIVTMGCVTRNPQNADAYDAFDLVEKVFLKYDGRPHWAKRFQADKTILRGLYEKWQEFSELRKKMDPKGKFLTPYLRKIMD